MAAQPNHDANHTAAGLVKDFSGNGNNVPGNASHIENDIQLEDAVKRIQTAGSIPISPELFEKLYLSPQNGVKGDFRRMFATPTPVALLGFLMCMTPLSCDLMGWRGTKDGSAAIGNYYFFGGLLLTLGAVGEWLLGNAFPCVVFFSFASFWLSFAATLQPFYSAYGNYSPDPSNPFAGLTTVPFQAGFGFSILAMAFVCFLFMILALRTNITFVLIFFTLVCSLSCITAEYWELAKANAVSAHRLQIAAGAFAFATSAFGWYMWFSIMLAVLEFPFQLPVGDLSGVIKARSAQKKDAAHEA